VVNHPTSDGLAGDPEGSGLPPWAFANCGGGLVYPDAATPAQLSPVNGERERPRSRGLHRPCADREAHRQRASTKSVGEVAQELDLTETSVREWVRQAEVDEASNPRGPLTTEERAEVARLRRELKRVTMERDILKKAAVLFAKSGS
jgi:transposase